MGPVTLFRLFLSAIVLAVQIVKRIPWKNDGIITKSWWCFVYLQWVGFLLAITLMLGLSKSNRVGVRANEADRNGQGIAKRTLFEVCSFCVCFVLSLALICITAVLDHKSDLPLRTKRVLAIVECTLLFLLLVVLIVQSLCGPGAIPPTYIPAMEFPERTFDGTSHVGGIRESGNVGVYDMAPSGAHYGGTGFMVSRLSAVFGERGEILYRVAHNVVSVT
ncbi:hypothetical protein ACJZTR_00305 [Neorickettsia risticii]|uniref:Uncharacterized protein n=1 Tax=Neorickettsia risticii (strain Illinois) TaxID=434131 RepID=C6V3V3_NEORI|nr:hypothetical protein [Neorickettsia risticii]ACT69057.1 conserved hypothetical protein [Neorickettsia risticii str. Illinois]